MCTLGGMPTALRFLIPLLLLCLAPAPALAASSLTELRVTNGDLVVDKTAAITLTGYADPEVVSRLEVDVNSPGVPCAPTEDLNDERALATSTVSSPSAGPFREVGVDWVPAEPGPFLLCAWLYDWAPDTTMASISQPVTVRPPRTSLELSLPAARFEIAEMAPLQMTAFAEVSRAYTVEVNPVGVPCGPNVAVNDQEDTWIVGDAVLGGPVATTENVGMPTRPGRYHVCGYIGRNWHDASPTTIVSGPMFSVGVAPRCRVASAPRSSRGTVRISCTGVDGPVQVVGRRGHRSYRATVALAAGRGSVSAKTIGLRRGRAVKVSVLVDGRRAGSRVLRLR